MPNLDDFIGNETLEEKADNESIVGITVDGYTIETGTCGRCGKCPAEVVKSPKHGDLACEKCWKTGGEGKTPQEKARQLLAKEKKGTTVGEAARLLRERLGRECQSPCADGTNGSGCHCETNGSDFRIVLDELADNSYDESAEN